MTQIPSEARTSPEPELAAVVAEALSDVRLTPSNGEGGALDALRLHIEHTEGLSMLLLKPYEIDEQSQTVAFGETAVMPTPAQVWSA